MRIAKQSGHIPLEGTPEGLSSADITADLIMNIPDITSVSHVHAWALTETKRLITLEVTAAPGACIEMVRRNVKARLADAFDLSHATVEVVSEPL